MNIKRFRAATMREALEDIKEELGEEALVLETKQVRAGGFLGFGAREVVEVQVALDGHPVKAQREPQSRVSPRSRTTNSNRIFNLSEDAPSTVNLTEEHSETTTSPIFATLAARAYDNISGKTTAKPQPPSMSLSTALENPASQRIELSETAPRVIHRKPAAPFPQLPSQSLKAKQTISSPQPEATSHSPHPLTHELHQLHAELREVKFAVGSLISRPAYTPTATAEAELVESDLEIYDAPFYDTYLQLAHSGFTPELARRIVRGALPTPGIHEQSIQQVMLEGLENTLPSLLKFSAVNFDFAAGTQPPSAIAMIGPTGVGKTTTIAKLAARLVLREGRRVELVTLDTYRIAAIAQLQTYAEVIGAGFHVAGTTLELEALIRRFKGEATVLIDTTGRSPHDLADQLEIADYMRRSEEMLKCLVLQASTQRDDALVAVRKFKLYGANNLVLTKLDETSRPGMAVSVVAEAGLPLVYLCAGQRVPEDFESATPHNLAAHIARASALAIAA